MNVRTLSWEMLPFSGTKVTCRLESPCKSPKLNTETKTKEQKEKNKVRIIKGSRQTLKKTITPISHYAVGLTDVQFFRLGELFLVPRRSQPSVPLFPSAQLLTTAIEKDDAAPSRQRPRATATSPRGSRASIHHPVPD